VSASASVSSDSLASDSETDGDFGSSPRSSLADCAGWERRRDGDGDWLRHERRGDDETSSYESKESKMLGVMEPDPSPAVCGSLLSRTSGAGEVM